MVLFVSRPQRTFIISDVYLITFTFILFMVVGQVSRKVIEKQKQRASKKRIANPRGGSLVMQLSDDNELALTILTCIADNKSYLVKDTRIKQVIFDLVKAKIKQQTIVLSPNLIRFLALKLINEDQSLIIKIGNTVVSSTHRVQLFSRILGAAVVAFLGGLFSTVPYAILIFLLYFDVTASCYYRCEDYFKELPNKPPIQVYAEREPGNLVIADNAREVDIYIPSQVPETVTQTTNEEAVVKRNYRKSPKRKIIHEKKFSDFKKEDPVLSRFQNLKEPDIPQRPCVNNEIHDVISITVE